MATVTYYRGDFLTGYTVDTTNTTLIAQLEEDNYTTNYAEAEADSFISGGQNFIGYNVASLMNKSLGGPVVRGI